MHITGGMLDDIELHTESFPQNRTFGQFMPRAVHTTEESYLQQRRHKG